VDLYRLTDGPITAVDFHQPYLEALKRKSQEKGLGERITALRGDMGHLPFQPRSFDLIWSEGAVYILGFKKGLETWRPLLRERGTIAVTELTWLQFDPPGDLKAFFEEAYPPMQGIEANLGDLRAAGYETAGHFTLPESAWWDYYGPIEKRIGRLQEKYSKNRHALAVLEMERQEMDLYRRYAEFYGYVFYIGRAL
jgi:ubiquinone/menaquinone biosynthesis C-methylase UbiE